MVNRVRPERREILATIIKRLSFRHYLVIVLGCAGIVSLLSNFGLCLPQLRFLSDRDYFRAAIEVVIHDPLDRMDAQTPQGIPTKTIRPQIYGNVDAFVRDFPACCRFAKGYDDGPELGFIDSLFGVHLVTVSYEKRYVEDGGRKSINVHGTLAVTCCGRGLPIR